VLDFVFIDDSVILCCYLLFLYFIYILADDCLGYVLLLSKIMEKVASRVFGFCVLVGAFSVFGDADTGKPVQNYGVFWKIEVFLGV